MLLNFINGCHSLSKAISYNNDGIKIDNIFDSGHKIVSIFLGISFIIVTASRYAVDPIRCSPGVVLPTTAWPISMIENYCYMGKTYVMTYEQKKMSKTEKDTKNNADSFMNRWLKKKSQKNEKIYQTRYYWMQYIILLQSFSFIVPKFFWKKFEGGKLKNFTSLLCSCKESKVKKKVIRDNKEEEEEEEDKKEEICMQMIALHWYWKQNFGHQNFYFLKYLMCEILYLVNVAAQYYFVDFLLNHMLYKDGWALIKEAFDISDPHLDYYFRFTFPVITMCEIPLFDFNSNPIKSSLTCVLTLNYLYRKIVFISWILFSILGGLTVVNILYHIFLFLCPVVLRNKWLRFWYNIQNGDDIEHFFNRDIKIGDWFFLYLLKQNMDPIMETQFREFIIEIIEKDS